jgi:hypothetical protein
MPVKSFLFAVDGLYNEGVELPNVAIHPRWQWSVGSELALSPIVVRGGVFTNPSLTNRPRPGEENQPTSIDYLGFSAGFGWRSACCELSLTGTRQIGEGQAQIVADRQDIQDVAAERSNLILGTSVSL